MSLFFQTVDSFLTALFGINSKPAQTVLHSASSYTNTAIPVVTSLASVATTTMPRPVLIGGIRAFLMAHEPDVAKVEDWITANQGMTAAALLHEAAVFVVSLYLPPGVGRALVDLAVQLAYNIFTTPAKT